MSDAYRRGRLGAEAHLQVELISEETYPETLLVVGLNARIFVDRSSTFIRGQRIAFAQPFYGGTAEYCRSLLDPSRDPNYRPNSEGWRSALYVEVYLNCNAGEWAVVCDQLTLLHAATKNPVNPAESDSWGMPYGPGLWDKSEVG